MSYNIDKKLDTLKELEIIPSSLLLHKTKMLARAATEQRKKKAIINWMPTLVSSLVAVIAIVFAVMMFFNANSSKSIISGETAAIYSLDINPSIELGVDLSKEVIEVKSLNEEGKELLKAVNCIGKELDKSIDELLKMAEEIGYIDANTENYVIVSEIVVKDSFESMEEQVKSIIKPESVKLIFLIGDLANKESADVKGISTGKEIFQKKAKEIGVDIKDSDLLEKSIKEVISGTTQEVGDIFNEKEYIGPVVNTDSQTGYILVDWEAIEDEELKGYKIVISKNNETPVYAADGYLVYLTDKTMTSYIIDNQLAYNDGDFGSYLEDMDSYYISVSAIYNQKIVPGNAVLTQFVAKKAVVTPSPTPIPTPTPTPNPVPIVTPSSNITGQRNSDGSIALSWDKIDSEHFQGYKVVTSSTNPNPKYPNDGYIIYITDKNTTSLNVGNEYLGKLSAGTSYYFSVTVLYNNQSPVAGNSIYLKYLDKQEPEPTVNLSSTITGERLSNGNIILGWEKIESSTFQGYKVVASKNNPTPKYPEDGYIKYITSSSTTSLLADDSFMGQLEAGVEYYFSITVLYTNEKVAGNAIKLKYLDTQVTPPSTENSSTISGQRLLNGQVALTWEQINDSSFQGYKVVASKNNPTPKYPEDGYIKYITSSSTTSLLVDESFLGQLEKGEEYYFSITVLYTSEKVAGNAIKLKYLDTQITPPSTGSSSTISGQRLSNGQVALTWEQINDSSFQGYKVVASKNNPTPKYPEDGYIKYITSSSTTSLLVDESFLGQLEKGEEYYFSITVLYTGEKVAGNAIRLQYLDEGEASTFESSTIAGVRLEDGSIQLAWQKIDDVAFSGYKIVASATNPNPKYPEDGYIKYITNSNTVLLNVGEVFLGKLTPGTTYYFSVTVLYGGLKVPGNAVQLQYMTKGDVATYEASNITGVRQENGSIELTWDRIDHIGFEGYKIVASATDPNPSYPDDGYITWITNRDVTSLLVDGSYSSKLTEGVNYYFSVSTLYYSHSIIIPGNSVYLEFK